MDDMTGAELLDAGRRLARRRMAWVSFLFLLVVATVTFGMVLLSAERESIAGALSASSGVLTGLMTVFASVVLGYLGVSVAERIFKRE